MLDYFALGWTLLLGIARADVPRAAVCLLGGPRGGPEVIVSIGEKLVKPLSADVFIYMPLRRRQAEGETEQLSPSAEELDRLYQLPNLMALQIEVENATASLMAEMRRWHPSEEKAQYVYELTRQVQGSWLGGMEETKLGAPDDETWRRPGSGLLQLLSARRCLEMVERAESSYVGQRYDWLIKSRLDTFWEYPHVPLELLSQDAIWIPEGDDWGGINDRHAVVPRRSDEARDEDRPSMSDMYFDSWRFLGEGKAAAVLHAALGTSVDGSTPPLLKQTGCWPTLDGPVRQPCLNAEVWLSMRLRSTGIRVKRLPPLAWVACHGEFSSKDHFRDCREDGTAFRYAKEYTEVTETTSCIQRTLEASQRAEDKEVHMSGRAVMLLRLREALRSCWCPAGASNALEADAPCDPHGVCLPDHFALCSPTTQHYEG